MKKTIFAIFIMLLTLGCATNGIEVNPGHIFEQNNTTQNVTLHGIEANPSISVGDCPTIVIKKVPTPPTLEIASDDKKIVKETPEIIETKKAIVKEIKPIVVPTYIPTKDLDKIYFDFDSSQIREESMAILQKIADEMKKHKEVKLTVGGFCDTRGSIDYNKVLGQKRADAAKAELVKMGVDETQIDTTSFGEEAPQEDNCDDSNCHQQNRYANFTLTL